MPLIHSASPKAIGPNIRREEAAGAPYRQALAIALSTQDRAKRGVDGARRYASGGTPQTPTYATPPPAQFTAAGLIPGVGAIGNYQLDPNTGALTSGALSNLQTLAQRGLPVSGATTFDPNSAIQDAVKNWLTQNQTDQTSSATITGPSAEGGYRGGRFAQGGVPSSAEMAPWFTRSEAHGMDHPTGLVMSATPGRKDVIPLSVASGSYVVPADVVSGISEGNTLAGARHLEAAMHTGPGGIPLSHLVAHSTMPHPPSIGHLARGGLADGAMPCMVHPHEWAHRDVPNGIKVIVAGGEYILNPAQVTHIGDGDLTRGHDKLDQFVLHARAKNVRATARLPGPKGAHEK